MMIYTTISGDTWDTIAKSVYGDERLTGLLMMSNFDLLDTLIFSNGVEVRIPDKPKAVDMDLPPWRR